jgi:hypothetical protein
MWTLSTVALCDIKYENYVGHDIRAIVKEHT